jgi:hypothetical protein
MTALEATSFWQWICSISVGDIINLLFASGTIAVAVLAFNIQKAQIRYSQMQTVITKRLASIELKRFNHEQYILRRELLLSIMLKSAHYLLDTELKNEKKNNELEIYKEKLPDMFSEDVCKLLKLVEERKLSNDAQRRDELLDEAITLWTSIFEDQDHHIK